MDRVEQRSVREVIGVVVARLRIDLMAAATKQKRGTRKVSDDKAKYALQLFSEGSLFTAKFPAGLRAVR
jgi:ABC-type transport system involved in Fe-S cluster assembly fused permease/ATPase subunit